MSAAGVNGEIGKAAIENWLSDHRLPFRPFLRGNLEKAIRYHENSKMGSSNSSLKNVTPLQEQKPEILASHEEDEENEDPRPAKRRKTTTTNSTSVLAHNFSSRSLSSTSTLASATASSSLSHSTSEESRKPTSFPSRSQVNKIKPTEFYGRQPSISEGSRSNPSTERSKPDRVRIDSVLKLTEPPMDFQKLLRIRVASIIHGPSHGEAEDEGSHTGSQYSNIKCTLALLRVSEDESLIDIYRQPQTGRIRRTSEGRKNDTCPVYLPPFHIPSAVLFQDPNLEDSSDQMQSPNELGIYRVQLLIEPYQANRKDWLPLTISSLPHNSHIARKISKGEARLTDVRQIICEFLLFDWNSKQRTDQIELIYDGVRIETSASLKLDIQWSLPSQLSKKEEIIAPKLQTPVPETASELVLPHLLSPQKLETIEPGSPPRAQRRGRANIPTYNLKALSAKAQGKKLKAQWSNESSGTSAAAADTGENATYTFSKANAELYGIKQIHVVAGFLCPICSLDAKCMQNLRLHFMTTHDRFTFHVRFKSSFVVEFNKGSRHSKGTHSSQIIQLRRATTLLDLEKYLSGDCSWAEVREGPQNNQWPDSLAHLGIEASPSPSPQSSRQSSLDILDIDTETKEGGGLVPEPAYIRHLASLPIRNKKKYYVPDIKNGPYPRSVYTPDVVDRVFYDLRTKRVLEPAEELPDSDDEKDEAWFLHKRKWIINDYIDLTDDEKEYLIKWEEFIMAERLTNTRHLSETIKRFVARNRVWFAEKKARKQEWHKQVELLVMRDKLEDQPLMSHCDKLFEQGKKELDARNSEPKAESKSELKPEGQPEPAKEMRGCTVCVCGDPVQDPDQVICSGERCPDSHYHKECAKKSNRSIVPKGTWLCDRCNIRASLLQKSALTGVAMENNYQDRVPIQR
ncbi:hypothetical protein SBOR_9231 [Sclerotinia borealis F-4128]|uniref:Zinc finger PHD-type domain-containing protein n=1 Tax=Sclerotinia borealis (strain F-4128) TaxID=1432307 RepID=W9C767_SCLBF|nr:hypothetical protein SBOR_9231 [Sclerotinia borealis F-4128]